MKKVFAKCPQVVFVDSTFNVNQHNYLLLAFMVMDTLGHGQLAQVSLQNANNSVNFREAVQQFKATHAQWRKIKVFITDKDLKEVDILEKEFAHASVLLCLFHVSKYLREECTKSKYNLSSEQREVFKNHLELMISADTPEKSEEYDTYLLERFLKVSILAYKVTVYFSQIDCVSRANKDIRSGCIIGRIGWR